MDSFCLEIILLSIIILSFKIMCISTLKIFLLQCSIPLYGYNTVCLSTHLVDILVVSSWDYYR